MEKTRVVIAGLPGKMATLVAEYVAKAGDMELLPHALSEKMGKVEIGGVEIYQYASDWHRKIINEIHPDVIIDFTLPQSVNANADLYCRCGIPFVMGTTGGDRRLLTKTVEDSRISAVIAPNMAKPIVAFQTAMEFLAENCPGVFTGYKLAITESHQQSKADTSGTAKALVKCFNRMGIPFDEKEIVKIRDRDVQLNQLRVGLENLDAHGLHTYTLNSPDGKVLLEFTHNVFGRDVYALGALDAVRFLMKHQGKGMVYSMTNVLFG